MSSQSAPESIPVIDVHNETVSEPVDLIGAARHLLLAGLGAVAYTVDEASAVVDKLAARGEAAENETQAKAKEIRNRLRAKRQKVLDAEGVRAKVRQTAQVVEEGVEEFMHAFNVPTRRDVEKLHSEIDLLNQKLDRLSQQN